MSDYIPTTKDVRDGYGSAFWYESDEDEVRKREAFDRWLEQHDKEVASATEERIIKQLEYFGTDNGKPFNPLHCDTCLMIASLIAFIKEEGKSGVNKNDS